MLRLRWFGLALLAAVLLLPWQEPASAQPAPEAESSWLEKPLALGRRHMVAAANPIAAEAGREILRKGGSAVDAAIAVQLVLGLVEPQSSGLGGGAFVMHWDAASGHLASYDGRETAPAAARLDRFLSAGRPMPFGRAVKSALSIGVPGTVRLLEHIYARHGKLPWAELFAPAIRAAESGFAVSPRLYDLLAAAAQSSFSAAARAYFFDPRGRPWPVGYLLVNPDYARTLRLIAAEGSHAFYRGAIADEILAAARVEPASAGSITNDDLANYVVRELPPLCVGYRGHTVCTMGPPSSAGHAIGQTLGMIEPFDLGSGPGSAMAAGPLHVMAEALKLAFADRARYLGDPAFVAVPRGLLDPGYLAERRRLIARASPIAAPYPGTPPGLDRAAFAPDETNEAAGTSHISIIDGAGNAVAMTTTIEAGFGSGRWAAGFLLNNELTDFSFRPSMDGMPVANRVEPGKRPRSSMAPTIVLGPDHRPIAVLGSAGGARIIPYVLKTIIAVIDWRLDPAAALALPNFGSRGRTFELEEPQVVGFAGLGHANGALAVLTSAMRMKPHGQEIVFDTMTSGTQLVVRRPDGTLEGAADPRREGVALGD
jgi:gamma-glutamyltranspeptidase/glutathione hydrolase